MITGSIFVLVAFCFTYMAEEAYNALVTYTDFVLVTLKETKDSVRISNILVRSRNHCCNVKVKYYECVCL